MTTRRGFLGGLGALVAAPAIVRASSLMAIKALPLPTLYGDGVHCDAEGVEAAFAGLPVKFGPEWFGNIGKGYLNNAAVYVHRTIILPQRSTTQGLMISNCSFQIANKEQATLYLRSPLDA